MEKIALIVCLTLLSSGSANAQDAAKITPSATPRTNEQQVTEAEVQAGGNDNWHNVKSSDGVVAASLPGKATKKLNKKRTLAGTITTKVMQFHTDEVEFTVTSSRLPRFLRRIADDERIYKTARDNVLNEAFGVEKSFEETTLDGFTVRVLHYEVDHFEDETHNGYHGVAILYVRNGKVYAANALMAKDAGDADLQKFRQSIRINK